MRRGPQQSEPTFEQAPSPCAGYQGTRASAGQRAAYGAIRPGAAVSSMGGSSAAAIPDAASISASQPPAI